MNYLVMVTWIKYKVFAPSVKDDDIKTLTIIIREYARQQLGDLGSELQKFERKYGLSFEAYRQIWSTEEKEDHYTFEAEDDYLMWEGMVTRHKRLSENFAWLP